MCVVCCGYIDGFYIFYSCCEKCNEYGTEYTSESVIQVVWDVTLHCHTLDVTADSYHRRENRTHRIIHLCEFFGVGTWEVQIFRDGTPCRLFNSYLCFGGPCCFRLEGIPFLGRWIRNLRFRNVGSSRLDHPEDGGSKLPQKFRYLPIYKASHLINQNLHCFCYEKLISRL